MRSKPPSPPSAGVTGFREQDRLWMVIDTETREALRFGSGPTAAGPAFFSSEEVLRAYCAENGMARYEVHTVPASVLSHMRGKPFWLDATPCTVEQAAHLLRQRWGPREGK